MQVKCALAWYSQPLTSIFDLVNSSIKKMRLECCLHPSHSMVQLLCSCPCAYYNLIPSKNGYFNRRHIMGYIASRRPWKNWSLSLLQIRNEYVITMWILPFVHPRADQTLKAKWRKKCDHIGCYIIFIYLILLVQCKISHFQQFSVLTDLKHIVYILNYVQTNLHFLGF